MAICLELLKKSKLEFGHPVSQKSQDPKVYPTLFYGLDLKNNDFFYMSESAKILTGYPHHQITQNGIQWYIQQIHPNDIQALNDQADQLDNEQMVIPEIKYRFRHKDGFYCDITEHRCMLHDDMGTPSYLIGRIERTTNKT